MRYRVVRFYRDTNAVARIKRNLTEDEAQEYCRSPEASSTTCKSEAGKSITKKFGPWFLGYERDRGLLRSWQKEWIDATVAPGNSVAKFEAPLRKL